MFYGCIDAIDFFMFLVDFGVLLICSFYGCIDAMNECMHLWMHCAMDLWMHLWMHLCYGFMDAFMDALRYGFGPFLWCYWCAMNSFIDGMHAAYAWGHQLMDSFLRWICNSLFAAGFSWWAHFWAVYAYGVSHLRSRYIDTMASLSSQMSRL